MKVLARRREGFAHEVEIEGGHTVVIDEPPEVGGTDTGPRPTGVLAASLAGCTAVTMELYAERKGWDLGKLEVEVDVEYTGPVPSSFAVTIRVQDGLSEEQKDRLLAIARKCPVHKALVNETTVNVAGRIEAL